MPAGLIGAIMQFIDSSSTLHWRMKDGDITTRWYPLGHELHAGGLGRITIKIASQPLTCYNCHAISTGHLYICCTQNERNRWVATYCLEHAPRAIEIRTAQQSIHAPGQIQHVDR